MNWNASRYLDEARNHLAKLKPGKVSPKDLDNMISLFDSCIQNKLHISQYDKLFQCFVEFFFVSIPLLPYDNLYRCFKTIIECQTSENKSKKIYFLIKNVLTIAQQKIENRDQRTIKPLISLVKKAAQKQFGSELVNDFIDFYVQKIQEIGQRENITLFILSLISNNLTLKYKYQTGQIIKNYIGKNTYFTIYLLLEAKQNPSYIFSFIDPLGKKLQYPQQMLNQPQSFLFLLNQVNESLISIVHEGSFHLLESLVQLFPDKKVQSLNELYDEILMRISVKDIEVSAKQKIVSDTWVEAFEKYMSQNSFQTHTIKFYALVKYFIHKKIIKIEKGQINLDDEIYSLNQHLFQDYFNMLGCPNLQTRSFALMIEKDEQRYKKWKNLLHQNKLLTQSFFHKEHWRKLLNFLFYEVKAYEEIEHHEENNDYLEFSQEFFSVTGIKPRVFGQKNDKIEGKKFKQELIHLNCLRILDKIVEMAGVEELVAEIKKVMLNHYGKVKQTTIKSNITNIFFVKSVVLTNHPFKSKLIFELIIKLWQQSDKNLRSQLKLILPQVDQRIVLQYAHYIASKDKYRFRLALFQKQMFQYEYLVQQSLSNLVLPLYVENL